MAIKDLLKPIDYTSIIDKLESDLVTAKDRFNAANKAWGDAVANEREGTGSPERTVQAEREHAEAGHAFQALTAALESTRARARAQAIKLQQDETGREWAEAIRLAEKRQTAVEALASAAAAYAGAYASLVEVHLALSASIPDGPKRDLDRVKLRPGNLENAAKNDLARRGVPWAASHGSETSAHPLITETFSGSIGVVKEWRDGSLSQRS